MTKERMLDSPWRCLWSFLFCIYPIVAKHFEMFFRDVDNQFLDEVQSRNSFSNSFVVFVFGVHFIFNFTKRWTNGYEDSISQWRWTQETSLQDIWKERSWLYLLPQEGQKRLLQRKGTNLRFPQWGQSYMAPPWEESPQWIILLTFSMTAGREWSS